MGPSQVMRIDSQGVVINIEAELAFWRRCYRKWPFHRRGLGFDAYVPTLKFGYDSYLLYHRRNLDELLPALRGYATLRRPEPGWPCSRHHRRRGRIGTLA